MWATTESVSSSSPADSDDSRPEYTSRLIDVTDPRLRPGRAAAKPTPTSSEPARHGNPLNRCDNRRVDSGDGLARAPEGYEQRSQGIVGFRGQAFDLSEIATGTEVSACTADDDDVD